jgi:hypothetical protein
LSATYTLTVGLRAMELVGHLLGPPSVTGAALLGSFAELTHPPELLPLVRGAVHCAAVVVVGLVLGRQETRTVSASTHTMRRRRRYPRQAIGRCGYFTRECYLIRG